MTTARTWQEARPAPGSFAVSKVPVITAYFWIIKVLTTGMGETTSDYLAHRFDPYVAVGLGAVGLMVALALQLAARGYQSWIYWLAVVMVSVFGTMAADVTHIVLRVPYLVSTVAFVVALAVIFWRWHASERTLSIHSIRTRRRELFYWATVLATFALGTAAGDMTARTLRLGFFASGVMFAVAIAIPAVARWRFGMNPILAFWLAYIVTRPLGASFADWIAIPPSAGGLGSGYGSISLVLTALIVGFAGYLSVTGKDVEERAVPGAGSRSGRRSRARRRGRHRRPPAARAGSPARSRPGGPQASGRRAAQGGPAVASDGYRAYLGQAQEGPYGRGLEFQDHR